MYTATRYADITPDEIRRRMSPSLQRQLVALKSGKYPYITTREHEQLLLRGLITVTGRATPLGWVVADRIAEVGIPTCDDGTLK